MHCWRKELQSPIVQQQLVELFTDGLANDQVARKLIRQNPNKLADALQTAAEEQQNAHTFELRRRNGPTHEPMEVDMQSSDPIQAQIISLHQMQNH